MTTSPSISRAAATTQRWRFIDSLRGFGVLGILLVNTLDISQLGHGLSLHSAAMIHDPVRDILYLTVQSRFVPIFTFLFGMTFWFVLGGARQRSARPWLVMLCRILGLALIGWLLTFIYPGNILLSFAEFGLVLLPIVYFAPRLVTLLLGAGLTIAAYATGGQGLVMPGLILLGVGAAAYGLPRILESAGRGVAWVCAAFALATAAAIVWQLVTTGNQTPLFTTQGAIAGLVMAVFYVTALSLIWRTGARRVIAAVFEPLGRMALSNYVGAALVVWAVAHFVDFSRMTSVLPAVILAVAIIAIQSVLSRLWLSWFLYGPIEWVWRTATWLRPAPFRAPARAFRAAGRTD